MSLLAMVAGAALVISGLALARGGLRELRRAGAFSGTFWSSMSHFAPYRRRALRPPLLATLAGLLMVLAGVALAYAGLTGYYAARLGHPAAPG